MRTEVRLIHVQRERERERELQGTREIIAGTVRVYLPILAAKKEDILYLDAVLIPRQSPPKRLYNIIVI
jgi:hypothetical protein